MDPEEYLYFSYGPRCQSDGKHTATEGEPLRQQQCGGEASVNKPPIVSPKRLPQNNEMQPRDREPPSAPRAVIVSGYFWSKDSQIESNSGRSRSRNPCLGCHGNDQA